MSGSLANTTIASATRVSIFRRMLRVRRFEETLLEHSSRERIGPIFVHIGQEATSAAIMEAAGPDDKFLTHHRNHGHVVARGSDVGRTYAELLGRRTGLLGGRGGGFHTADHSLGFLQSSAIVGGSISLLAGAGFAIKQTGGGDRVAIGFFGDSALEEGVAYEALNVAALWKLPAIFVCENNSSGVDASTHAGMPTLVHSAQRLTSIPEALGITTRLVNGADAGAVYAATLEARRLCIEGKGPVFLETPTDRWTGSQTIMPQYLGETEIEMLLGEVEPTHKDAEWAKRSDPLLPWTKALIADGAASRDELVAIDIEIKKEVAAGLQMALDSPRPDPATALERVFA
jgi:acetoin:2,6-dichlorophenolindophenol oxidoreductase subunit alpha